MIFSKRADLVGIAELDRVARLSVLEGVLGVAPGSLIRKGTRELSRLRDKLPEADPMWFTRQGETGLIRMALTIIGPKAQGMIRDKEDWLLTSLSFPRSKKTDENRLYYIGKTNKNEIMSGKLPPNQVGKFLGTFMSRKILSDRSRELKYRAKERKKNLDSNKDTALDQQPSPVVDIRNRNSIGNIIVSMMTDASNPLSRELWKKVEAAIDRYPFERLSDPEKIGITKETLAFINAFAKNNPRTKAENLYTEMITWLSDHSTPRNKRIFDELFELKPSKVEEVALNRGGDPDLRRTAYKLFIRKVRMYPTEDITPQRLADYASLPIEEYWGRRFSKINAQVSKDLGFKPKSDATMTRMLGVHGRNVLSFVSKVLSKDPQVKKTINKIVHRIQSDPEFAFTRRLAKKVAYTYLASMYPHS